MGQYWKICDLNSMYEIPNGGGSKLGEFFYDEHKSLDALLEGTLFEGRKYVPLSLPSNVPCELPRSNIMSLPSEVLVHVVLDVEDEVDRFCLGLSCVKLFSICEKYWLQHYPDTFLCPRLLCAGDYASWRSVPKNCRISFKSLLRRPSALNMPAASSPFSSPNDSDMSKVQKIGKPYSIIGKFSILKLEVSSKEKAPDPLAYVLRVLGNRVWKRVNKDIPSTTRESMLKTISSAKSEAEVARKLSAYSDVWVTRRSLMFPRTTGAMQSPLAGKPKVLCNLSKKLFVLEQPMFTVVKQATRTTNMLTLGHIALSQVCCSEDGDNTMKCDSVQGSWAGDPLQVMSQDGFLELLQSLKLEDARGWRNRTGWALDVLLDLMEEYRFDHNLKRQFRPGKTVEEILNNGFV